MRRHLTVRTQKSVTAGSFPVACMAVVATSLVVLAGCAPAEPANSGVSARQVSERTAWAAANCRPDEQFSAGRGPGRPWRRRPEVVVLAKANDARVQTTRDAAGYWNGQFDAMGSGFRLGKVTVESLSYDIENYMSSVSDSVTRRSREMPSWAPAGLNRFCGSIVVVLTDSDFISFAKQSAEGGFVLVGIKGPSFYPLDRPNATRNVIAHEIGHAVGLRHNTDPTTLMCGRPSPCGPTRYEAITRRFFPLTGREKRILLRLYPADWSSE